VDLEKLGDLLMAAPKDEVYRIKAVMYSLDAPCASTGEPAASPETPGLPGRYILNWAFGRWTFTAVESDPQSGSGTTATSDATTTSTVEGEPLLRMTIVSARYESTKWRKRIEAGEFIAAVKDTGTTLLNVKKI
jgi:hypothetical protein